MKLKKIDELSLTDAAKKAVKKIVTKKKEGKKPRVPLNGVRVRTTYLGCDPEFFFKVNKRVVGAEHFIAEGGMVYGSGKFVIDGVQAELNPYQNTCRANLANEIAHAFRHLRNSINNSGKKVKVCFDRSVEISRTEFDKLKDDNKRFGCMPSFNVYEPDAHLRLNQVDPTQYLRRSAGGHIHISLNSYSDLADITTKHLDRFIHMLDIVVGNTCVLIDLDKGNKERRKLYGRAGEYRLPKHGVEYRVLSNFWLDAYPLMSLVFGLVRVVISIAGSSDVDAYYKQMLEAVDLEDIRKAINNNDYKLAMKNYKAVEGIIFDACGKYTVGSFPFDKDYQKEFNYFLDTVKEKGIKHFFPQDPLEHWCNLPEAHTGGFSDVLGGKIREEYFKSLPKAKKA